MKMKRLIAAGTAAMILLTAPVGAGAAQVSDFTDVSSNAWYYNAVEYAAENGLFAGTSADTFSPDLTMTRGMFVTVLGRMAKVTGDKPNHTSFSDVSPSAYYAPYVEWAAENDIVNGTSSTTFSPEQKITREQMVTLLYRFSGLAPKHCRIPYQDVSTLVQHIGLPYRYIGLTDQDFGTAFSDADSVSTYAREAMGWAVASGLIAGTGDRLEPKATATRAQVAQVFYNARNLGDDEIESEPMQPESSLEKLRRLVEEQLPESCQWDERALQAGWYGPMRIGDDGDLENIARGCVYMLTQIHGGVYDYFYLEERTPEEFYLYYG